MSPDITSTAMGLFGTNVFGSLIIATIVIVFLVLVGLGLYIFIYLAKFKIPVEIHNERADGTIFKTNTKGGFIRNPLTKVESFKILKDFAGFIKPMPNKYIETNIKGYKPIKGAMKPKRKGKGLVFDKDDTQKLKVMFEAIKGGKDKIFLRKTAYDEYIPMTVKVEMVYIDNKSGKIKETFTVYPEFIKGWLAIKHSEVRSKYGLTGLLDKFLPIISLGLIVVIWILTLKFFGDRFDQIMQMAAQSARIISTGAP